MREKNQIYNLILNSEWDIVDILLCLNEYFLYCFNSFFPIKISPRYSWCIFSFQLCKLFWNVFLSFDWFIEDYEIRGFAPNNSIFKIFLTALLPLMIVLVFCVIFVVLYYVWNSRFADIKRNIGVSAIWIVFLLHPTLTRVSFNIFQCIKVDTNDFRMRNDLGKLLV